jgi:myo-inositol-1(or 4)-monophosphatase
MSQPRHRDDGRLLLAAEQAVDTGAGILRQGRSHIGTLIGKGDRDFATDVDLQIETAIKESLAGDTPELPLLGEEEGGGGASGEPCWVLDPIDGTINFAGYSPLCAISPPLVVGGQPEMCAAFRLCWRCFSLKLFGCYARIGVGR